MRYLLMILVIAAGAGVALYLTSSGGAANESSTPTRGGPGPKLRGTGTLLRGAGWIGSPPRDLDQPADSPRLLLFVEPGVSTSDAFARRALKVVGEFDSLETIWVSTAPDAEALTSWMQATGARGPALYGMDASVPRQFGGGGLPMLRLIDRRGRVVARDLIGLKAHSLDR